jgi:serine/threonine protein kinase
VAKVLPAGQFPHPRQPSNSKLEDQTEYQKAAHQKSLQKRLGLLVDAGQVADRDGRVARVLLLDRVPGKTLTAWKEVWGRESASDRLSPDRALRAAVAMRAIARNLAQRWEQGWVHADVKPANLMVDMDYPFLSRPIDFGIAMRREQVREKMGATSGTPTYMTAESMAGKAAFSGEEAWRDMYALGLSFGESIGLFSFARGEGDGVLQILNKQSHGKWVQSPRFEGEQVSEEPLESATLDTHSSLFAIGDKTPGSQAFIRLLYSLVRPHDRMEDRRAAWRRWHGSEQMLSWEDIERELTSVIGQLEGEVLAEQGEAPLTQEELEAMRRDIAGRAERAKNRVFASWRIMSESTRQTPQGKRIEEAMQRVHSSQDSLTQLEGYQQVLELMATLESHRKAA